MRDTVSESKLESYREKHLPSPLAYTHRHTHKHMQMHSHMHTHTCTTHTWIKLKNTEQTSIKNYAHISRAQQLLMATMLGSTETQSLCHLRKHCQTAKWPQEHSVLGFPPTLITPKVYQHGLWRPRNLKTMQSPRGIPVTRQWFRETHQPGKEASPAILIGYKDLKLQIGSRGKPAVSRDGTVICGTLLLGSHLSLLVLCNLHTAKAAAFFIFASKELLVSVAPSSLLLSAAHFLLFRAKFSGPI